MAEESLSRAESARAAVARTMREEICISLPIPVVWEGSWTDAFFTFSISTAGMFPYPAQDCRIIAKGGDVIIRENAFDLQFQPYDLSGDQPIADWGTHYRQAYDSYDAAFEELVAGVRGEACATYTRAVRACTPASQLPYYRAMCPLLFQQDEEPEG